MRYSAFEQAAAEASLGVREVEAQMEQLKNQIEQLKSKRDLLETLSRQLISLRPMNTTDANASDHPRDTAPAPEAQAAEAAPSSYAPDLEPEMAGAYTPPRSLRESGTGWFSRNGNDSGIRGRL